GAFGLGHRRATNRIGQQVEPQRTPVTLGVGLEVGHWDSVGLATIETRMEADTTGRSSRHLRVVGFDLVGIDNRGPANALSSAVIRIEPQFADEAAKAGRRYIVQSGENCSAGTQISAACVGTALERRGDGGGPTAQLGRGARVFAPFDGEDAEHGDRGYERKDGNRYGARKPNQPSFSLAASSGSLHQPSTPLGPANV